MSAILGELPTSSGEIKVKGEITYANQVPWVFAGTVRENILFGEDYDALWYDKVTKACGLERVSFKTNCFSVITPLMYVCMGLHGAYNYSGLVRQVSGFINIIISA